MAVRFDTTATLYTQTAGILPTYSAFSICGWFNRTGQNTNYDTLFCLGPVDSVAGLYLGPYNSATRVSVWVNGAAVDTGYDHANGQTAFFAMTCDGSNTKAYVRTVGSNTFPYAVTNTTAPSGTIVALTVGTSTYDGTDFVNGRIWNVKSWKRVLTEAELLVESFYARVVSRSNLNFYLPLRVHTDMQDYSGLGNHLTSNGGAFSTEDTPWQPWKPGSQIVQYAPATIPGFMTRAYGPDGQRMNPLVRM